MWSVDWSPLATLFPALVATSVMAGLLLVRRAEATRLKPKAVRVVARRRP